MGEVADIVGGGTPKSNQAEYFGGDIPWITPADLSGYTGKFISAGARGLTKDGLNNSGAKLMPAGAVLFSSRAPIGYVAIAANPVSTNQGFKSFVLRGGLTPDFVYYYLQHAKGIAVGLASGTTFLEISGKKAAQIPIPVAPLPEQRRIVAEIEKQFTRLEAGVAALRRVQASLQRYRAAVLKAACEGDWPRKPLGEIAEVKLGKMLDKTKHVAGRKLPYLRNVNVRWGKIDTDDLFAMYFEKDELERFGLKVGDVLVCEGGEPGRAAVWIGHCPEMKYQKALHRVRFNIPFDPRLLVWLLERLASTGELERRFTGSTIKHFTREAFVELPIPLPPLGEQERIVAEVERRLSVVEELSALVEVNIQRAARLRQAVLQQAFTGNLA